MPHSDRHRGLAGTDDARAFLDHHLFGSVLDEEWVQHVEHDPELMRWYVRFGCEGRDAATIYFDLKQRSLYYELYFMPAPDPGPDGTGNARLWEWLLARNRELYRCHFALGSDGDVYLLGRVPIADLDETVLDEVIGEIYGATEVWFQAAITIGFRRRTAQ